MRTNMSIEPQTWPPGHSSFFSESSDFRKKIYIVSAQLFSFFCAALSCLKAKPASKQAQLCCCNVFLLAIIIGHLGLGDHMAWSDYYSLWKWMVFDIVSGVLSSSVIPCSVAASPDNIDALRFSSHTWDKATKAKVTLENYYSNLISQHLERKQR